MPFIKEKISAEESALVHWEQYKEYQHPWSVNPTHWFIDRERNAFAWCIRVAAPGSPFQLFGLSWKGDAGLRVEAVETTAPSPSSPGKLPDITVNVLITKIPDSLKPELGLIKSALKEVFDLHARRYDGNDPRNVLVSIP